MGLRYRKSTSLGNGGRVNVSGSKRGVGMSVSQRVGPLTLNSRGTGSLRVAPGLSLRFGKRNSGSTALIVLVIYLAAEAIRLAIIVLFYAAVIAVWLGKWAWYGSQALLHRIGQRGEDERPSVPSLEP